jgi:hypothetical protein
MKRATLDPVGPFGRHRLQPHQLTDRTTRIEDTIVLCHLGSLALSQMNGR